VDDYHGAQVEMPAADKLPIPPCGRRGTGLRQKDDGVRWSRDTGPVNNDRHL